MSSTPPRAERTVLTLALGPDVYWNLALNLARSIRRWHSAADLPVTIVTDRLDVIPADLPGVETIRLQTLYLLFLIEVCNRRDGRGGCTDPRDAQREQAA